MGSVSEARGKKMAPGGAGPPMFNWQEGLLAARTQTWSLVSGALGSARGDNIRNRRGEVWLRPALVRQARRK